MILQFHKWLDQDHAQWNYGRKWIVESVTRFSVKTVNRFQSVDLVLFILFISSLGTLTIHKSPKNHIEESFGYVLKVNTEFDKKIIKYSNQKCNQVRGNVSMHMNFLWIKIFNHLKKILIIFLKRHELLNCFFF